MKLSTVVFVSITFGIFVSVIGRSVDHVVGLDNQSANFTTLRQLIYDVLEKQRLELVAKEEELRPIRECNDWLKANLTEQLAERHRLEHEMVNIHTDDFQDFFRNVSQLNNDLLSNDVELEPSTELEQV